MRTSLLIFNLCILCFARGEISLENVDLSQVNLDGFSAIKEKCDKQGGNGTYESLKAAQEKLKTCLQGFINFNTFQNELEESKKTGSMDEVFGKYCGKRSKVKTCILDFTNSLRACLNEEQNKALNVTLDIAQQLGEFLCFKDGDRMAMFIAEGGVECIQSRTEGVQNCVNSTLKIDTSVNTNSLPDLLLDKKKCDDLGRLQTCVVQELEKCKDSTPANIIDALFRFIKRSACTNKSKRGTTSHNILKRSLALASRNQTLADLKSNLSKLLKKRCERNAPPGALDDFNEDFDRSIRCINNASKTQVVLLATPDTLKQTAQVCTEKLIAKATICLPEDEKYLPHYYLRVFNNLVDFVFKYKEKLTTAPTPEMASCFRKLRRESGFSLVTQCVKEPMPDHIPKEDLCKRARKVKQCATEEIQKRCIADIEISKMIDEIFDALLEPCNSS